MATENKTAMVTVRLPLTRAEKDDVYVAVNGKSYLIKRGEPVKVPASVAEVLERREKMLEQSLQFEQESSGDGK